MENLYLIPSGDALMRVSQGENELRLLARHPRMEIMEYTIHPGSLMWISPGDDPSTLEYYRILEGTVCLGCEGESRLLHPGDSFYLTHFDKEYSLKSEEEVRILFVTSAPCFEELYSYMGDIEELLHRTEAKDPYTNGHGKRVMKYSIAMAQELGIDQTGINNLTTASLFHDVGKCFIPLEVLNKPGRLTDQEFEHIRSHPVHSQRLLAPRFGKDVAQIALCHHERLNGRGYPHGIQEGEISLEARIIAVADSFDAMTTDRPYRKGRDFEDAVAELETLAGVEYDVRVVAALRKLSRQPGVLDAIRNG